MTEEKLCGGKTFKEVMDEVNFHIHDKHKIEQLQKENTELKAQISILLSCKECPENKGGYICEKEYNDKCLAQKIEYIKELKEENEELVRDKTELANSVTELKSKVTELEEKLKKVSEWVKEQEYPDGCIDCESWDTDKLKDLVESRLIDYVAMDVKNSLDKYAETTGVPCIKEENIVSSIEYLKLNKVDYEFRTTIVDEYHTTESIKQMAVLLKGAKKLYLQKFVDREGVIKKGLHEVSKEKAEEFIDILKNYAENVSLRGY